MIGVNTPKSRLTSFHILKLLTDCAQLEELYGNPLESLPPELFALSWLHTLRLSAREFAETAHLDARTAGP